MYGNAILLAQSYVPSNNSARVEFWAAVGAVFGAFLFFRGFSMLRIKRLILNTPSSKIRSASMGLVEITGMATGPHTIPAGITGEPCFYYRAMAWQLRQSGRSNQWRKVADESLYVPFFVEDSTGRMLVNPQGAELDVHRNFKDEIGESLFANRDTMPENIAMYLLRNGLAGADATRIEEYCIKPDYPLFVLGTLGANDTRGEWKPVVRNGAGISFKSRMNPFGPAANFGLQVLGAGLGITAQRSMMQPWRVPTTPFTASSARPPAQFPAAQHSANWSSVSMDEPYIDQFSAAIARHSKPAPSPALPTASVAVAEREAATPIAPIAAAPEPPLVDASGFEISPAVAIGKGADGKPFTISWKSQRDLVQELAWKSTLCIWGGPILALVCLYILGISCGWLSP
jgi:hypothetical protein